MERPNWRSCLGRSTLGRWEPSGGDSLGRQKICGVEWEPLSPESTRSIKSLCSGNNPSLGNFAMKYFVDHNQLNFACALREGAGNLLVIHHDIPHDHAI